MYWGGKHKIYSENDDIALSPIIVDEYNNNELEKDDAAVNQIEGDLSAPEDSAKTQSLLMTGKKKQAQTWCNDRSHMSTGVINMYDDPNNWPADIDKNVRDYLTMKGPPNIPVNSFTRNGKGLCFSK